MNAYALTVNQLKRAAAIKEHIEALNKELRNVLGASAQAGAVSTQKRTRSAAARRKIAAAQKARWAKPPPLDSTTKDLTLTCSAQSVAATMNAVRVSCDQPTVWKVDIDRYEGKANVQPVGDAIRITINF